MANSLLVYLDPECCQEPYRVAFDPIRVSAHTAKREPGHSGASYEKSGRPDCAAPPSFAPEGLVDCGDPEDVQPCGLSALPEELYHGPDCT